MNAAHRLTGRPLSRSFVSNGNQFGGPSSLPSFTASLLLNTTRLYSVPAQPCGEFRTRREHPHRLFTTVAPIQHPRYRARHILKRQDPVSYTHLTLPTIL